MRALTTVLIAGAILLVVAVGLLVRTEQIDKVSPRPLHERPGAVARAEKKPAAEVRRSARVEERLRRRREGSADRARERRLEAPPRRMEPRPEARDMLPTPGQAVVDDDVDDDDDEETAELVQTVRTNPDPEERASALFFLSGAELHTVLPVILDALNDPDAEVRLAAVEALDEYTDEIDPEVLEPALNDPSPEVRFEALGIVGDMEDSDQVRDVARRMLNDPDEEVRALAEGILDMEGG